MESFYFSCAIFQCRQCGYQTEIYSADEYLPEQDNSYCALCKFDGKTKWDVILIHRNDICDEAILHPQCAFVEGCKSCQGEGQKHWTEMSVRCPHCKVDSMQFSQFTTGKHITTFKEYCLEWSKPQHPPLEFAANNDKTWIFLSGPYSLMSAT
jgi:hypothetical protein